MANKLRQLYKRFTVLEIKNQTVSNLPFHNASRPPMQLPANTKIIHIDFAEKQRRQLMLRATQTKKVVFFKTCYCPKLTFDLVKQK